VAFALLLWLGFPIKTIALPIFGTLLAAIVIFAHRKNIVRLLHGEESKMNLFKR
jgi:glycerol-3-phosphate acyltransferase PlsY